MTISVKPKTTYLGDSLIEPLQRFSCLDAETQLIQANDYMEELKDAVKQIAGMRRGAVRTLRSDGYTLKEIAEMLGTTVQRIHQIESGYNRHEQKARKQAS